MVQNEINSLCLSRSRQSSSVASSSTDRAHPSSRKVCRNADAGTPGVERTASDGCERERERRIFVARRKKRKRRRKRRRRVYSGLLSASLATLFSAER